MSVLQAFIVCEDEWEENRITLPYPRLRVNVTARIARIISLEHFLSQVFMFA